jgi:hypothetical protein
MTPYFVIPAKAGIAALLDLAFVSNENTAAAAFAGATHA